jgi:hypothetical protein
MAAGDCKEHSGCIAKIENLEKSDTDQWATIHRIESRPPVWTTVLISVLTFALGASMTYAKFAVEMAEIKAAGNKQAAVIRQQSERPGYSLNYMSAAKEF